MERFSRVPLATLKQSFAMGETFHQHERGEISDEDSPSVLS
jgi:putative hydrolase of the HAD superfamily